MDDYGRRQGSGVLMGWPVVSAATRAESAAQLRRWMEEHGWSIIRLAERTGFGVTTVKHWRAGDVAVASRHWIALEQANVTTPVELRYGRTPRGLPKRRPAG